MHHGNKQAYDAAYQRGLAGKSSRPIWGFLLAPFEDEYTRQSREKGQRDGAAARALAEQGRNAAPN
jgi:ribosome modulation factor